MTSTRTRRWGVGGGVAVAAIVMLAVAWLGDDRDEPPPGSLAIERRGELVIRSVPRSYRVVYRVDNFAGGEHVVTTEDVRVNRPLESRVERRSGEPTRVAVQVSTFGRFSTRAGPDSEPSSIVTPPELAASDLRFDVALDPAAEQGLVVPRDWRRVAGRDCRVFRTAGPVGTGELLPYRSGAGEHADVCVDEDGLLLEEVWTSGGRTIRRKLATEVELGHRFSEELLRHEGTPEAPMEGGGSLRPVEPSSYPPGTSFLPTTVPDGFTLHGRYAVFPPQPNLTSDEATEEDRDRLRTSIVDVWTRGPDLLLLDQGGTLGNVDVFRRAAQADRIVVGGDIGDAEADAILGLRMNEVRILRGRGAWVRVRGTLPIADLVAVARDLQRVESETGNLTNLER